MEEDALEDKLKQLNDHIATYIDLEGAGYALEWDQETYMPPGGVQARADQLATLEELMHRTMTDEAIGRLLALPEPPTAIFAATDDLAMVVLKIVRQLGVAVPSSLAVIGFDDLDVADYLGLTTISQNLDESGRAAAELLLARLADPSRPVQRIRLPLGLIERETA